MIASIPTSKSLTIFGKQRIKTTEKDFRWLALANVNASEVGKREEQSFEREVISDEEWKIRFDKYYKCKSDEQKKCLDGGPNTLFFDMDVSFAHQLVKSNNLHHRNAQNWQRSSAVQGIQLIKKKEKQQ